MIMTLNTLIASGLLMFELWSVNDFKLIKLILSMFPARMGQDPYNIFVTLLHIPSIIPQQWWHNWRSLLMLSDNLWSALHRSKQKIYPQRNTSMTHAQSCLSKGCFIRIIQRNINNYCVISQAEEINSGVICGLGSFYHFCGLGENNLIFAEKLKKSRDCHAIAQRLFSDCSPFSMKCRDRFVWHLGNGGMTVRRRWRECSATSIKLGVQSKRLFFGLKFKLYRHVQFWL